MTITEFLLARIAEDEERAQFVSRQIADNNWTPHEPWRLSWHDEYDLLCIEPSRALAECAAKRRIVEQLQRHERLVAANAETHAEASSGGLRNQDRISALRAHGWELDGRREALRMAVDSLAAIYADHPDFDSAWRA